MKHEKADWILAVDPGNEKSGYIVINSSSRIHAMGIVANSELLEVVENWIDDARRCGKTIALSIETVASYGMAVGKTVFETCFFIGRVVERALSCGYEFVFAVYRRDVKMNLCETMRAKDANIRQAIIDRYPNTGGGKNPVVGTKSNPGPLYGVSSHMWSALAVALTTADCWDDLVSFPGTE